LSHEVVAQVEPFGHLFAVVGLKRLADVFGMSVRVVDFLLAGRKDTWQEVSGPAAVSSAVTTLVDAIKQDGIAILKHGLGDDPTRQEVS
jgi:hypothetical protein